MINITVTGGTLPQAEIDYYVEYVKEKLKGSTLDRLDIRIDGDFVDLTWRCVPQDFERIRRITGYLVGTMDRWNNAKAAEEKDRVKHI